MKRKPRISTIIFILLMAIGLGVMFYPTACDWHTRWQLSKEIGQYNEKTEGEAEDYSALWEAAEEYNRFLLEKESQFWVTDEEKERVAALLNPLGNGMMGRIEIPKININLPIYQGTDEQELQSGAGYWIGSSLPTGSESAHCVITAHTGLVKAKLFTDIDQLEEGDLFFLHILDRDIAYEVDQILITEPDEMEELYVVQGQDYVTLYTCYPYGVNTQRLLVRGKRTQPDDTAEQKFCWLDLRNKEYGIPLLIAMGLLLLMFLLVIRKILKHRKRKKQGNCEGK